MVQGVEFHTQILTMSQWPFQTPPKMTVPSKLSNIGMIFRNFYDRKFQNRELNWLYDKGSVVVQTTYLAKAYQLEVTVTQCAVLM